MFLRDRIKQDAAFQYVVQSLELMSPVGQRRLMSQAFCRDADALQHEWDNLERVLPLLRDTAHAQTLVDLRHQLMCLHDIQGTLAQLRKHQTLTEVDLYELKHLAYLTHVMRRDISQMGLETVVDLPKLGDVFALLDPDNTGIDNFYIYDSYDPSLAPMRTGRRIAWAV